MIWKYTLTLRPMRDSGGIKEAQARQVRRHPSTKVGSSRHATLACLPNAITWGHSGSKTSSTAMGTKVVMVPNCAWTRVLPACRVCVRVHVCVCVCLYTGKA